MITKPKLWIAINIITMLVSVAVILAVGPNWGIDFTGGSLLEIETKTGDATTVQALLSEKLHHEATVQPTETGTLLIRTDPLPDAERQELVKTLTDAGILEEVLRFELIGPTIGSELRRKAWVAVALAVVATVVYLAYEFRHTSGLISSWKYGVAAAIALIHDLLVVLAIFVVLGRWYGVTIDLLFVTALLAILSYSVNDTVVIFNRLRQEWVAVRTGSLLALIDRAARVTLMRSLNISLAILLVLIMLVVFGGSSIRWFNVALAAGTIVGTYSSLFVAPPMLWVLSRKR